MTLWFLPPRFNPAGYYRAAELNTHETKQDKNTRTYSPSLRIRNSVAGIILC
jgi:hypothetical protein